jgi:hypothetical protein
MTDDHRTGLVLRAQGGIYQVETPAGVVEAVLRGLPDLRLEAEEGQVPGRPGDGGYWARLRKK